MTERVRWWELEEFHTEIASSPYVKQDAKLLSSETC